jgi:hypothetical protein
MVHIVLLIIFSTIIIKFAFNIKWLLATSLSITNSIFLLFIIPYLYRVILFFSWLFSKIILKKHW